MERAPRRLTLRNFQAPGDVLMLTAAVRDILRHCPGQYAIDVRTSVPQLWENNPYLCHHSDGNAAVEVIDCEYRLIDESNLRPVHFLEGFTEHLSRRLQKKIRPTEFKGDIHLSRRERESRSSLISEIGSNPYWLISAGGKRDFTLKWWDARRYQRVVDHFRGQIQFVQIGAAGHFHPELEDVIDLRSCTTVRQLIHLMHHASGVVTPVSFLMHLAAAVEMRGQPRSTGAESRPCVVIAGGREPPHWEAYPTHQFLHTVGMLPCCRTGGCWRSRVKPLGDGSPHDETRRLCVDVVGSLPRCMDMISAEDVIRRIEMYVEGSHRPVRELKEELPVTIASVRTDSSKVPLTVESARAELERAANAVMAFPETRYDGRGIVVCAGGIQYLICAWVCVRMLKRAKCTLPIQIWHLGEAEMPGAMQKLFHELGVECVDATRVRRRYPVRRLGGWELKAFALLHCPYREVMLLDADNVPLTNPANLFETAQFRRHGAIFWPDIGRISEDDRIWKICGIDYQDEPEFESGQMLVDKKRCWKALSLALWMNEHSDFFYKLVHGDKETFHLAFRKLGKSYAMPQTPVRTLKAAMCQHDFEGKRIFQHRNLAKWRPLGGDMHIPGFLLERTCFRILHELRARPEWQAIAPAAALGKTRRAPDQNAVAHKSNRYRLVLRAPVNAYTGYGLHCCQIFKDFTASGCDVRIHPTMVEERFVPVPPQIRSAFLDSSENSKWELLLHPPHITPRRGAQTVYFTMWESTRLPSGAAERLNLAEVVIAPCQWNAECFRDSGVSRDIRVIPLGINTEVFRPEPMDMEGLCVFGAAGRADSDPKRKRVNDVIALFQKAFPSEKDVRLRVKVFPDCDAPTVTDPRVNIIRNYLSEPQLAAWFRSITCFVSLARAEGWGLMQHQALATGRPLICARFGGVAEFFEPSMGYPLNFRLVPAEGRFTGCGEWAEPSEDHAIALMRHVYANRLDARVRGAVGAEAVARFSWREANSKLAHVLQEVGMLKLPKARKRTVSTTTVLNAHPS